MENRGSTYIEIIICMSLLSVIGISLSMGFNTILRKNSYAQKNYYANVAAENLINAASCELEKNNSLSNISEMDSEYFYADKFNYIVRANRIDQNFAISPEIYDQVQSGQENFLDLDTKISCDDASFTNCAAGNYLVTVEVFDKDHKLIKHLIKICAGS